ncbi:MAG: SprT family zinc-dependent metalloprotease [Bacilli bacterium]
MDNYIIDLGVPLNQVTVEIKRKSIKNVHLKVNRDLKIVLSLPNEVDNEWIVKFLDKRKNWISKQLLKYKQSSGYNNLNEIKSGSSTQLLGKDRRIIKNASLNNHIDEDEINIIMYVTDLNDINKHQQLLEKWWRAKAENIYTNEMNSIFDKVFKKYDLIKPYIYIRKMKTLWGSCTPVKNKVTLNEYLLKADVRCIQYVVLHELTHLLFPYHNNEFYNFLTIQMPDWKERKTQLDKEVVQGL